MLNILYYILEQVEPIYLRQIVSCATEKVKDRLTFIATMGLADLKKNTFDPTDLGFDDFEELQQAMSEAIREEDVDDIIDCVKYIVTLQGTTHDKSKIVVKETLKPKICPKDVIKTLPLAAMAAGRKKKFA